MKTFKPSALSLALMLGGLQLAAIPNFTLAAEVDTPEAAAQTKKDADERKRQPQHARDRKDAGGDNTPTPAATTSIAPGDIPPCGSD